jgi:hypothetical protein
VPYMRWVLVIDLVLIDQQSVGKRNLHLMNTVNAKKRRTTIYWRVNKVLKESHIVTRLAKELASFLKTNDISFLERLAVIIIDLILIDQQSVGKRSLHLMDTVNVKKRWTTI